MLDYVGLGFPFLPAAFGLEEKLCVLLCTSLNLAQALLFSHLGLCSGTGQECGHLREAFILVHYYTAFVYSYLFGIKVRCYFLDYSLYRK